MFTDRDRDRMADVGTIDKYEMQLLEKKKMEVNKGDLEVRGKEKRFSSVGATVE
jgi:hypothetical protein